MRIIEQTRRFDPTEAAEIWKARFAEARLDYLEGRIGLDTLSVVLYGLGYRDSNLRQELYNIRQERQERDAK